MRVYWFNNKIKIKLKFKYNFIKKSQNPKMSQILKYRLDNIQVVGCFNKAEVCEGLEKLFLVKADEEMFRFPHKPHYFANYASSRGHQFKLKPDFCSINRQC